MSQYIHFTNEQKRHANAVDLEQFLLQRGERLMLKLSDILFIERRERKNKIVCANGFEVTVANYTIRHILGCKHYLA